MIGNAHQVWATPTDYRVRVIDLGLLLRMAFDIALDAVAREVRRVERVAGRHGLGAGERVMLVDKIPARTIDHQQASQFWILRFSVYHEAIRLPLLPEA